jgi:BMFP domain-containing protein YqiC
VGKTDAALGSSVVPNSHTSGGKMVFESVRGYVQLASGLSELTRARATEAAHGLLSLQGSGIETGSKLAVQVSALAEELLAAATANRHNLTTLVRTEVDAAVNRIGLVPAEQLQASQAELAELRAELAALRASLSRGTTAKKAAAKKTTVKKTAASKAAVKKSAVKRSAAKETSAVSAVAAPVTMTTATGRSAVTTRRKPAGA